MFSHWYNNLIQVDLLLSLEGLRHARWTTLDASGCYFGRHWTLRSPIKVPALSIVADAWLRISSIMVPDSVSGMPT